MRAKRSAPPAPDLRRTHPAPPEQIALRELVRISGLLRRLSEPHFATYGISPAQWGVLRSLARLDDAGLAEPRMHELGQSLLVQPPSLSATLDRMERVGLVSRRADPVDQRTRRIGLTAAGRRLLEEAMASHHVWMRNMMSGLSAPELDRLASLLTRLGSHMLELAESPRPKASKPRPMTSRQARPAGKSKRSVS